MPQVGGWRQGTPLRARFVHRAVLSPHLPLVAELVPLGLVALAVPDSTARMVPVLAMVLRALRIEPRKISPSPLHGARTLVRDLSLAGVAVTPLIPTGEVAGFATGWSFVVAAMVSERIGLNLLMRATRATGLLRERVLVLGATGEATAFAALLGRQRRLGLVGIPIVDACTASELDRRAREVGATRVIVLEAATPTETVRELLASWHSNAASLHVLMDDPLALSVDSPRADVIWGNVVIAAPVPHRQRPPWVLKCVVERLIAATALLAIVPLLGIIAVAVRRSSPGPILFRQERIGWNGKPFTILKFRTMPVEHRDVGWNAAHDSQPTRLGRVLRATSLDELPQLWNVVRGEMSLVGPRPELPHYVDEFSSTIPGYRYRHRLPVGLTGWAQAHGLRGATSLEERVRFDNTYIDRWSLNMELVALMKTAGAVVRNRAHRPADGVVIDLRDGATTEQPDHDLAGTVG